MVSTRARALSIVFISVLVATAGRSVAQRLLRDLDPIREYLTVYRLTGSANGLVYFAVATSSGADVWRSDGTAAGTRILIEPNPGHGSNPRPASARDLTVDSVLRDVDRVVRRLSLGSWHLVGYSMGGRMALAYAAAGDDGLASLTTISASPGIADPARRSAPAPRT